MENIIVIHEKSDIQNIVEILNENSFVAVLLNDSSVYEYRILVSYNDTKKNKRESLRIEYSKRMEEDFEEEEKATFSKVKSPIYGAISFQDLSFLKKVLRIILENINCYVDNNYDNGIFKRNEFIEKLIQNPNWNWAEDYYSNNIE